MKRFLKWTAIVFLILVVLPVTIAAIVVSVYSKDIANKIIWEAKSKYKVDLYVGKISFDLFANWPHASIQLNNVLIHGDTLGHKFSVVAGSVDLSFNAKKLLQKSFEVRQLALHEASVHVIRTETNIVLPPSLPNDTSSVKLKLSKINLKNIDLQYDYPATGRTHGLIAKHVVIHLQKLEEGLSGNADGTWWIKGLTAKKEHGPFLANTSLSGKIGFTWFNDEKTLMVKPCLVKAGLSEIKVAAIVIGQGDNKALLKLNAKKAQFNRLKVLVNENIRSKINKYTCNQPLDVDATLILDTDSSAPPRVKVAFESTNATVTFSANGEPFKECTFKGMLDLTKGDPERASVKFNPCKAKFKGHMVNAKVHIFNLRDPYLSLEATVSMNAANLAEGDARKHNLSGTITTDFSFEVPLKSFNIKQPWLPPAKLSATIRSANLAYSTHQGRFKYLASGEARLIGNSLKFSNVKLKSPVGILEITGTATQLPEYLSGNKEVICQVDLFAHSHSLDINKLFGATTAQKSKGTPKSNRIIVHLQLLADNFTAKNFRAEKLNASMNFSGDDLTLKNLQMKTCKGNLRAQGALTDLQKLSLNIEADNLDIKELFKEFNNFNQQAITSAHLAGRLQSQSRLAFQLDKSFGIVPGSMVGDVDLHVIDGHLLGFPPLIDLQNALFPNRNFHDVAFTELSERFTIRGNYIRIHELEVASDLLSFFVAGGIYNLNGPSVINVLIPWSNLKKKKGDMPKLSGKSAEDARGVKINFSGIPGQMKFGFGFKPLD